MVADHLGAVSQDRGVPDDDSVAARGGEQAMHGGSLGEIAEAHGGLLTISKIEEKYIGRTCRRTDILDHGRDAGQAINPSVQVVGMQDDQVWVSGSIHRLGSKSCDG
jgi:hypothetical protein